MDVFHRCVVFAAVIKTRMSLILGQFSAINASQMIKKWDKMRKTNDITKAT